MGRSHGKLWSALEIEKDLLEIVPSFGRMPSANELVALGRQPLAVAISKPRYGGYAFWAKKLGLSLKGTSTHRGQAIEVSVALFLTEAGFEVERCSARSPFDLLVNGKVRVDVKSATFTEYRQSDHWVRGHVFGLNKKKPTCDLYVLCGVDGGNAVLWRYFIPAAEARVRTLTVTPEGKYSRFKEALGELKKLCEDHMVLSRFP